MIGELVKCMWLEESLCIIIDEEKRSISGVEYYYLYKVFDFMTGQSFWVDEEDLEKV